MRTTLQRLLCVFALSGTVACDGDSDEPIPSEDAVQDTLSEDTDAGADAGEDADDSDGDVGAEVDTAQEDVDAELDSDDAAEDADAADTAEVTPLPPYERQYPLASEMPAPEGHRWARSIVHLHSTHSHDACDDVPRLEDGGYNLECMHSLRDALCDVKIDVAWLTDHPTHMDEVESFADLLLYVEGTDELVLGDDERPYANWIGCEDGHRVLLRAGAEDSLMPLGLRAHVAEDFETRHAIMNGYTAEDAAAMRAQDALIWVAHTEQRTAADLNEIGVEGMEVYQLHANLDPRIREEWLGLDSLGPVAQLFPLLANNTTMPPDLAFLVFAETNEPSLRVWAEILVERPMVGTAGTDAHENTFPGEVSDGERLDSYRRMMAWFTNYLLVEGELTPESARAALAAGNVMIVFDVVGDGAGLDFAVTDTAGRHEMGDSFTYEAGATLAGTVPTPVGPSGIEAAVTTRVLRAVDGDWEEVATYGGGDFEYTLPEAGAYRVEVRVTGAHFAPYLDHLHSVAERDIVWVMSNAWRVGLD